MSRYIHDIYVYVYIYVCVYIKTAAICLARYLDVKQMAKDILNTYTW